jgi:hypothetical protein
VAVIAVPEIVKRGVFGRLPAEIAGEGLGVRQAIVDPPPDDRGGLSREWPLPTLA